MFHHLATLSKTKLIPSSLVASSGLPLFLGFPLRVLPRRLLYLVQDELGDGVGEDGGNRQVGRLGLETLLIRHVLQLKFVSVRESETETHEISLETKFRGVNIPVSIKSKWLTSIHSYRHLNFI